MVIVAGPSGGGKSSIFPICQMQIDAFSADLRAATLLVEAKGANGPVFQTAPAEVALYMQFRQQAGQEMDSGLVEWCFPGCRGFPPSTIFSFPKLL